jgi:hypothetical protein
MGELAFGVVELLFEHGLDIVESVLERFGPDFPPAKEHFIRLGPLDRPVSALSKGAPPRVFVCSRLSCPKE